MELNNPSSNNPPIMASKTRSLILLLSLFLTVSSNIRCSQAAGGIAIYWGQNFSEGALTSTCDTRNYEIVLLSFLNVFGCGRNTSWNFAGHCGDWSPCTKLEPKIKHCQNKGVKVFLSLGGAIGNYSICSPQDAKKVAKYLYNNFLSGQFGPLGSVTLDGIDFAIVRGSNLYWDDLAKELDALRQPKKFYLSAAPQCPFPDCYLDKAIRTGLFDDIFVQFYNNPPCQYSSGSTAELFSSWDQWTSLVLPNHSVFLGLPASPEAAPSGGYIPPDVLISQVLPYVQQASNYGGVMLWSRCYDRLSRYSDQIKPYVDPKSVLHSVTAISDAIFECVSTTLHRLLPKSMPW